MEDRDSNSAQQGDEGTEINAGEAEQSSEGPLLVAMQPGSEVPQPVEVVVVTAEDAQQLIEGGEIQTVVDTETGQIVTVAAVEEVAQGLEQHQHQGHGEYTEQGALPAAAFTPLPSDIKGVTAEPGRAASDSSDDLDSSSEEEVEMPKPKKIPKKREFAYRYVRIVIMHSDTAQGRRVPGARYRF